MGYTAEELKQLSYWDLTPECYADAEQQQLNALTETGRYGPYVKQYRHKNGDLIDIELNGVLFSDAQDEKFIWAIIKDIREIKRLEKLKDDFVQDQGPGIAVADQPQLFKRFSQLNHADNQAKVGTGLGLAINREIALHSGGDVGVKSAAGQEATFLLEKPVTPELLSVKLGQLLSQLPTSNHYQRILHIEDDQDIVSIMRMQLENLCDYQAVASLAQTKKYYNSKGSI